MLELLSLPPVFKGLLVLSLTGLAFPVTGVYLFRLNLLPLRFMLMHGAILGGAMALAFGVNPFWTTIAVNLLLVSFMARTSRSMKTDAGQMSAFFMVISISLAFIFIYKFNVPAKDTLTLLWGNLWVLSWSEVTGAILFSAAIIVFQTVYRQQLRALFFDREIAFTSGISERNLYYTVVFIVAITVAIAMKLIGALLLDALLLLPPLIASLHSRSLKGMILASAAWGGLFSVAGFFLSLAADVPASSAIAVLAAFTFLGFYIFRKK